MSQRVVAGVLILMVILGFGTGFVNGQQGSGDEIQRRMKVRVQPQYPEIAKRMNITGTVRIQVVVLPNGAVKEARVVGGHPVLAVAALDAAKRCRFEPAAGEATGVIDFKFEPQ